MGCTSWIFSASFFLLALQAHCHSKSDHLCHSTTILFREKSSNRHARIMVHVLRPCQLSRFTSLLSKKCCACLVAVVIWLLCLACCGACFVAGLSCCCACLVAVLVLLLCLFCCRACLVAMLVLLLCLSCCCACPVAVLALCLCLCMPVAVLVLLLV